VCRHTNPSLAAQASSNDHTNLTSSSSHDPPFGSGDASLCSVCDCTDDLWICLICGSVGCGRYKRGHAKDHWKHSAHNFALEIETQHVWDYAGDVWVHRLIRDKGDSKVIELPSRHRDDSDDLDLVPREKLDSIGFEYTHLLTSQLESQRVYFEDLVSKAAAKASAAAASASSACARADDAAARLKELALEHARLRDDVVAGLEKDLAREKKKGERSAEVARGFGQSLVEEKKVSEGLMKRVEFVNASLQETKRELEKARSENQELREENRDLMFALQAGDKLRAMEEGSKKDAGGGNEADDNGKGSGGSGLVEGEVLGGTVSLPPPPPTTEKGGKRKGKGRGR
jgi:BRCA1-associated protein